MSTASTGMGSFAGRRRNFGMTSYDIGLMYSQPAVPFYLESRKSAALPPLLNRPYLVSPTDHFSATSLPRHDHKSHIGPLTQTRHPRPPPHWKTHFPYHLEQKIKNSMSARLVSAPVSEMQDRFRGEPVQKDPFVEDHQTILAMRNQLANVPPLRDPLVSTAQCDYRFYSRSELSPPSGLDACPSSIRLLKSSAHSQLPPHKAPPTVSSASLVPRQLVIPLPYSGKQSCYKEAFTVPHDTAGVMVTAVPPRAGAVAGGDDGGVVDFILGVPKMYLPESLTYGGNKMVVV